MTENKRSRFCGPEDKPIVDVLVVILEVHSLLVQPPETHNDSKIDVENLIGQVRCDKSNSLFCIAQRVCAHHGLRPSADLYLPVDIPESQLYEQAGCAGLRLHGRAVLV